MSHRANPKQCEHRCYDRETIASMISHIFLMEVDESDMRHEFKSGQCPRCGYPVNADVTYDEETIEYHFPCKACDRVDIVKIRYEDARCTIARSQPIRADYPSLHRGPSN